MHGAPCGMLLHQENVAATPFNLDTTTFTKPMDFKVDLLPLVAPNRKI